jgi:hypothetical protein
VGDMEKTTTGATHLSVMNGGTTVVTQDQNVTMRTLTTCGVGLTKRVISVQFAH